mmetsp:Transcript_24453/g.47644  ORF Transcript_24453/g.47644 Transcript_24453/m.47644 type:complete len:186 (+) Transcript_24453:232-789(+)
MSDSCSTVDGLMRFKETCAKENAAQRAWKEKYGSRLDDSWQPVEPFEKSSYSRSKCESPTKAPSRIALRNPELYRDSIGDEGLAGGTPKRFGGRWDKTAVASELDQSIPSGHVVRRGPHDCYCDVGFKAWSMAGHARTENHGRRSTFKKELWTNTPGELALVWDYNGKGNKDLAQLDKEVASNLR